MKTRAMRSAKICDRRQQSTAKLTHPIRLALARSFRSSFINNAPRFDRRSNRPRLTDAYFKAVLDGIPSARKGAQAIIKSWNDFGGNFTGDSCDVALHFNTHIGPFGSGDIDEEVGERSERVLWKTENTSEPKYLHYLFHSIRFVFAPSSLRSAEWENPWGLKMHWNGLFASLLFMR